MFQRYEIPTWGPVATATVALIACVGLTERQIWFWHDSERLFRHAVNVTEGNFLAWNNLGFFLQNSGKTAEAMECSRNPLK